MLEIKYVRQNFSQVTASLLKRGQKTNIENFQKCDEKRSKLLLEIEELRHKRNVVSEDIAKMKKNGENTDDIVREMRDVSNKIKTLDKSLSENEAELSEIHFPIGICPAS